MCHRLRLQQLPGIYRSRGAPLSWPVRIEQGHRTLPAARLVFHTFVCLACVRAAPNRSTSNQNSSTPTQPAAPIAGGGHRFDLRAESELRFEAGPDKVFTLTLLRYVPASVRAVGADPPLLRSSRVLPSDTFQT